MSWPVLARRIWKRGMIIRSINAIKVSNKFYVSQSWSICHGSRSKRFFFRSLLCCLWILGFNILVKKIENCERIINGILFLYLAGKRKCSLAICWIKFSFTNTPPPESSSPLILTPKVKNNLQNALIPSESLASCINKGNTC